MITRKALTIALLGFVFSTNTFAQDTNEDKHTVSIKIPEVAIIDLHSKESKDNSVTLSVEAPTEAGLPVSMDKAVDNSVWMNYSSIVGGETESSRVVSVKIAEGDVPGGMSLNVEAAKDAGNGEGTIGSPAGLVTLSADDQKVVTGIGSCYTADGAGSGHNLTYSLTLNEGEYSKIDFDQATTLTILYTISNN